MANNPVIPSQNEPFLRDGNVSIPWRRFLENIKKIITNNQNLDSFANLGNSLGFLKNDGSGNFSYTNPTKSEVGLGDVLNAAQLVAANNLSDLDDVDDARDNLGLAQGAAVPDVAVNPPADGVIGGLTIGIVYSQAEVVALRNQCELLRDALAATNTKLETLQSRFEETGGNGLIAD